MTRVRAPEGLEKAGRSLWRAVTNERELAARELELLRQACATADLIARATGELGADLVVPGSTGQPKAHPLLAVLADQRRVLAGLLRALGAAPGAGQPGLAGLDLDPEVVEFLAGFATGP